ncbi:transcript variant X2 [Nothobranchius furzeri]|uniref:Transcript variant X2 n=1 Tax=Nothobranchius furzeri TaxID=105023 RepID=A0A9D3C1D4_NOTFU|nr:transcript variant X2 [Nothobranchius furzeri]
MTSHAVRQRSRFIGLLASATTLVMMMSLPTSAAESETCFSRQHQSATVNVRVALSQARTAMNTRVVHSERDCVLACCSEEIRPGLRCNMAVFKSVRHAADENCLLFHCPTEQDCPLMKASDGINTYDIYKGLSHPPTLRPVTMTTAVQTTSSTAPTTKLQTTTTTTASAPTTSSQAPPTTTRVTPTTSQAPPTTAWVTPTTSQAPPTTTWVTPTTSQAPPTTARVTPTTSQAPPKIKSPSPIILIMPMPTTTSQPATMVMTPGPPPTPTSRKLSKNNKKQNKASKKGKLHPFSTTTSQPSISSTSLPATTKEVEAEHRTSDPLEKPTESTTPPTTTVLTTTATVPTTTTAAAPPPANTYTTTTRSTAATTTTESSTTTAPPTSLIIVPKDILQSEHTLQNSSSNRDKTFAAHRALNSGVVAVMVVGLAMLTLALTLGGRKAMESFDRRHYTRLELNDLHYEI